MKKTTNRALLLIIFYLFIFYLYPYSGHGQQVYKLSKGTDLPLMTGGVAGSAVSFLLRARHQPLTDAQIAQLDINGINAFDRPATRYYGEGAREASDILLTFAYALPLTTLFFQDTKSEVGTFGIMLAETLLLNEALTGITKTLVERPRPYTYNPEVPEISKTGKDGNMSFFSGHTSYTAALSFFSAKVITDHTDNRTVEIIAWTGAALLPAVTGYMRYRAGKHFPTDIITGYIAGAGLGYLVPQLHKIKTQEKEGKVRVEQLMIGPGSVYVVFAF